MKKRLIVSLILSAALMLCVMATDRNVDFENGLARDLKELDLFSGVSDTDFDLGRAPSRVEAIVMLVRLLGEEETAKNGNFEMPFKDVPDWAAPYVGYAYSSGLTQGVSKTEFGMGEANASTYITFVLRALGYSDAEGDFDWSTPYEFAKELGILPSFVDTKEFLRADAVTVSYLALSADIKYKPFSLAEKLMQKNVFTSVEYIANYSGTKVTEKENESKKKLSAEELFDKCSDSVFYVEVQSENGIPLSSGSGFFIDEFGTAITNWHVVNGADKITVTLQNGETYEVENIWDYNPELDYAVISVDVSGYTPLVFNPLPLKTGAEVYAIGSPKGLQNTITHGIVSNPSRVVGQNRYIQASAAISGGSSGGVLLNSYGEVVGITSSTYDGAQNLNFARPISVIAGRKKNLGASPASTNWDYLRCEFDKTEYEMLPGDIVKVKFKAHYFAPDGEIPSYTVYSSDKSVAIGKPGIKNNELYVFATGEGTAVLTIGGVKGKNPSITVTVGEGDSVGEYVGIVANVDSLELNKGAKKVIKTDSFTVNTEEKTASISASSKNSKVAKVEYLRGRVSGSLNDGYVELKNPRPKLLITGVGEGSTEIVVKNNLTGDKLIIPVTVGNCYDSAYERVSKYVFDNGVYSPSNNGQLAYHSLDCGITSFNEIAKLLYYPMRKELHLQIISNFGEIMYFDIIIGEEPFRVIDKDVIKNKVDKRGAKFNVLVPSKGIDLSGEIAFDGFGDGKDDKVITTSFEGSKTLINEITEALPNSFVNMLYIFDNVFEELLPGTAISDFGFTDVDYEAYGIN